MVTKREIIARTSKYPVVVKVNGKNIKVSDIPIMTTHSMNSAPKGKGEWVFKLIPSNEIITLRGTYVECKNKMKRKAFKEGQNQVLFLR